ncbi:2TM domain-containing protein [Nonlabens marinus]|uniref:2TM domain-containing protein n=1 Tax=Nonlabens marinus S1-08 TaxID=1454201 RepID=W8VR38_9FLAO|nr:2TM domain-containing protein [Nonlabens marinus]BAO56069.1 hypothetical protein NMS_2060 [Nonlabens marinus S1-08]
MQTQETYQEKYARAKARVQELKSFYNHIVVYAFVNLGLAGLNYYTNQWSFPWFLFPLLGWGIGLSSHAVRTFQWDPLTSQDWEERKIQEILRKEENQSLQ